MNRLLKSAFVKNTAILLIGTASAQAIQVLGAFALARMYNPEEFAVFSFFTACTSIILSFSSLRFELAVALPKSSEEAEQLVALSLRTLLRILGLVVLGIVLVFAGQSVLSYNVPSAILLVPLFTFFAGFTQILNYWSTRNGTFTRNALAKISVAVVTVGTSLLWGFISEDAIGLIYGAILGQVIGWFIIGFNYSKLAIQAWKNLSNHDAKLLWKSYSKFPTYNAPNALVDNLQQYGILFLLGTFFASEISSYYFQSIRILAAPLALIGASIYQVFYPKAAKAFHDTKNIRGYVLKIYGVLFAIGFPIFTILFLFTENIFVFLLGETWRMTAVYAHILIPFIFMNFLISPVSAVTAVVHKQHQSFAFSLVGLTLKIVSILIGGLMNDPILGFTLFSLSGMGMMLAGMVWYWYIAKERETFNHLG
jgi:O-antigen/teichoic acid export membrane protein